MNQELEYKWRKDNSVQGGVLLTVICLVITTEEFKKFLSAVAEE
jgi:hypothetical protein